MSRYRERWRSDGTSYVVDENAPRMRSCAPGYMPDIDTAYGGDGFRSPVDRKQITSRSQLREHNKRHNVTQYGDVSLQQDLAATDKHYASAAGPHEGVTFEWTKSQ
jgi:hypothetical protein